MGMQESRGKLGTGFRDLLGLWNATTVHWNDANSHKVQETLLKPLEQDIRIATSAMDQMGALLSQIKRECE